MDSTPSRGRRGNGLHSDDWGALVDLDPRLSEALLARLAQAGVAAYVEPAAGSADAFSRAVTLPSRPLDRLWVDAGRADAARTVVQAEVSELTGLLAEQDPAANASGLVQPVPRAAGGRVLRPPTLPARPAPAPGGVGSESPAGGKSSGGSESSGGSDGPGGPGAPASDPDEQWRRIVEGFAREAEGPVPPWPVVEDVEPTQPREREQGASPTSDGSGARRLRRRTDRPDEDAALPAWLEPAAVEDEGHYVPPPPPPVPKVHPRTVAAAVAVVVGVLLLFAPRALLQDSTAGTSLLGLLLTAGGAGALVWWMRDAPPHDSGPDDGAVV
jgi:hypothetical protein